MITRFLTVKARYHRLKAAIWKLLVRVAEKLQE
jgi:hypothetical protein